VLAAVVAVVVGRGAQRAAVGGGGGGEDGEGFFGADGVGRMGGVVLVLVLVPVLVLDGLAAPCWRDDESVGRGRQLRGFGVRVVVVASVRLAIEAADAGGLFVPVGAHVFVAASLASTASTRLLAFRFPFPRLRFLLPFFDIERALVLIRPHAPANDAPTPQHRPLRRVTQRLPIRSLATQDGRLVILPVALAPHEAAVLGPEEEPDAREDERGREQAEQRQHALVVDRVGRDGAGAAGVSAGVAGRVAGAEESAGVVGGEDGGAFAEQGGRGGGWGVEAFAVEEREGGEVGWEVGGGGASVELERGYAEVGDAAWVYVAGGEEGRW